MNEEKNFSHWTLEKDPNNFVWLNLDVQESSANVLSADVLSEFHNIIESLHLDHPEGLVIYSGKKNGFIMGADIKGFIGMSDENKAYELIRQGQQVLESFVSLGCPKIAVINGFALGGGLELAMACDYRIGIDNKKPILGLPEVKLGLHPGFGGTVRTIEICGVRPAMKLMLTGKSITLKKAYQIGLIDKISNSEDWQNHAKSIIKTKPKKKTAPLIEKILNLKPLRGFIAKTLNAQVASKANKNHYPAPFSMIDLWLKHGANSKTAYQAEARSMAKLICSNTGRNLVRLFFLQNKMKSQFKKIEADINNVHVIGAGVMGGDIASWCALKGLNVTLQDRSLEDIEPAIKRCKILFEKRIKDDEKRKNAHSRLKVDINGDGIANADLIIEAIFENKKAKKDLYKKIENKMKPSAILATNTSSILLEDLRSDLAKPEKFIGIHFFNPVSQLPLVEIIKCDDTDQSAIDVGLEFVKIVAKSPLLCKSSEGFVVNRLLGPYMAEAMHLAREGVGLTDIDNAAVNFGMPMGPVELVDTVGIDVALNVSKVLGKAYNRPVPDELVQMVESKKLGKKSGEGFYKWVSGKAIKSEPTSPDLITDDIEDRLILPMVNEAIKCLNDGIVSDADMLDIGVIFGTGFAPFRGGPIQYAKDRGIENIISSLDTLTQKYGDRFKPSSAWSNIN